MRAASKKKVYMVRLDISEGHVAGALVTKNKNRLLHRFGAAIYHLIAENKIHSIRNTDFVKLQELYDSSMSIEEIVKFLKTIKFLLPERYYGTWHSIHARETTHHPVFGSYTFCIPGIVEEAITGKSVVQAPMRKDQQ